MDKKYSEFLTGLFNAQRQDFERNRQMKEGDDKIMIKSKPLKSMDKIRVSGFKLLKEYKIGAQIWYILIDADTLVITKKENCFPVWKNKGWYSLIYHKVDKYETIDAVDFDMLMIQKQIVTISKSV